MAVDSNSYNRFDTNVAEHVGIMPAILYYNIAFWCDTNRKNKINFHDGYYWTYNSIKAYKEQFPYMSEKQIRTSLKKLEDSGYIKSGCYNEDACDKTKWYADLLEKDVKTPPLSICPTGQMDLPHRADGFAPQGKPIPDINTNINTNNNIIKETKAKKSLVEQVMDEYPLFVENPDLRQTFLDFSEMRRTRKKNPKPFTTERMVRLSINRVIDRGENDVAKMVSLLEDAIEGCWDKVYGEKDKENKFTYKPKPQKTDVFGDMLNKIQEEKSFLSDNSLSNIDSTTVGVFDNPSGLMCTTGGGFCTTTSKQVDVLNLFD